MAFNPDTAKGFNPDTMQEPTMWETTKNVASDIYDVVTGESKTAALPEDVRNLPEMGANLSNIGTGDFKKDLQISAGLLTTFDDKAKKDIIESALPDVKWEEYDGTTVAVFPDGKRQILNKAGFSQADAMSAAAAVLAFIPAGKLASFGSNLLARMGITGAASGATEYGLQKTSQALGSEQEIDKGNIALATAGGAGGELVAQGLSKVFNIFRNVEELPVSQQAKEAIKNVEKEVLAYQSQYGEAMPERQVLQLLEQNGIPSDAAMNLINRAGVVSEAGETVRPFVPEPEIEKTLQQSRSAAIEGEQRYRTPLSEGQRSGSPEVLQFEESARMGGQGVEAQRSALKLQGQQQSSIPQAVMTEAEKLAPTPLPASSIQAAEAATGGVKSAAEAMDAQVKAAYEAIPKGSRLSPRGVIDVATGMQRAVSGLEFDRTLENTGKALADLGNMKRIMTLRDKQGKKGLPIEYIEQYRRKLNGYIKGSANNPTDERQLIIMKNAMDDYLDTAIAEGLLTGDQNTLQAMKNARGMRRQYSELFEPQASKTKAGVRDRDAAGILINKMAELEPDPSEVVSALFASDNAFGKKGSAEFASRMKQALGEDSPEWQQLRQAAFLRIFGLDKGQLMASAKEGATYVSGQNTLKRLQDVVGGRGKNLAKEMFSKEEIDNMIDLARHIKRTQPTPFNPSGTAGMTGFQNQKMNGMLNKLLTSLSIADPSMTTGVLTMAGKGRASLSDKAKANLASQVFSGKPLQKLSPSSSAEMIGSTVPAMSRTGQQEGR